MKKRCTNSSCRKQFQIPATGSVTCPHCKKTYPRINATVPASAKFVVVAKSIDPLFRVPAAKLLRANTGCTFRQSHVAFRTLPSVICVPTDRNKANRICGLFPNTRVQVEVLSIREAKKMGAFVAVV